MTAAEDKTSRIAALLAADPEAFDWITAEGYRRGADEARAGSLDAAWQEAEAALPEGWSLSEVSSSAWGWQARAEPTPAYKQVRAHTPSETNGGWATMWLGKGVHGDTPAAALRALAAALREAKP